MRKNGKMQTYKKILFVVLALILLAGAGFLLHVWVQEKRSVYQLKVDENALENAKESKAIWRKIEVNNRLYRYNTAITNILYMGIDTSNMGELEFESDAGQADSIMLLSIDRRAQKFWILAIPRDTMTKIRMYDAAGNYLGKGTQHLNLAYAFGDGGIQSCELTAEAVSQLLMDIPINQYVSSDISSIGKINDLVGGVTVTVPGDDLEYIGKRYQKGTEITLRGSMAETFVRSRNTGVDFSNSGRMIRQRVYLEAFFEKMSQRVREDLSGFLEDLDALESYSVTNLRASDIEELLTIASKGSLGEDNFRILEGENRRGELHDEFYVDEEKLQELILELYYVEI